MKYIVLLVFFSVPFIANATSYDYVCGDFTFGDTPLPSCSGGVITWSGGRPYADTSSPTFSSGSTVYVTYDENGTGPYSVYICGTGCDREFLNGGGSATSKQFTMTVPVGSAGHLYIQGDDGGGFTGTTGNFCLSDTSFAECVGGGGGTPVSTSTATTTELLLSTEIGFNAIVLFMVSLMISGWTWLSFMA